MVKMNDLSRFFHFDASSFIIGGFRVAKALEEALLEPVSCPGVCSDDLKTTCSQVGGLASECPCSTTGSVLFERNLRGGNDGLRVVPERNLQPCVSEGGKSALCTGSNKGGQRECCDNLKCADDGVCVSSSSQSPSTSVSHDGSTLLFAPHLT